MFSLDQLWLSLSTEQIGFYPYRSRDQIPSRPGVYAWFLPLNLQGSPEDFLASARKIFAYDSLSEGRGVWSSDEANVKAGFNWDPLRIEISRDEKIKIPVGQAAHLSTLKESPDSVKDSLRNALLASSIFAKPLYVGLANNLFRRHGDHTSEQTDFCQKFTKYAHTLKMQITIQDLLFVCIPLAPIQIEDEKWYNDAQVKVLEYMLKTLCQPAFSER